jgi:hypothetical protein
MISAALLMANIRGRCEQGNGELAVTAQQLKKQSEPLQAERAEAERLEAKRAAEPTALSTIGNAVLAILLLAAVHPPPAPPLSLMQPTAIPPSPGQEWQRGYDFEQGMKAGMAPGWGTPVSSGES